MPRGYAIVDADSGEVALSKAPLPGPLAKAHERFLKDFGSPGEDVDELCEELCVAIVPLTSALEAVYRTLKPTKQSKLSLSAAEHFRKLMRDCSRMDRFNCIGLAVAQNGKYGTISGRLAELENEGYIQRTSERAEYDDAKMRARCPELNPLVNRVTEREKPRTSAIVFVRTKKWSGLMRRWETFLRKRCCVCLELQKKTDSGAMCKNGHGGADTALTNDPRRAWGPVDAR